MSRGSREPAYGRASNLQAKRKEMGAEGVESISETENKDGIFRGKWIYYRSENHQVYIYNFRRSLCLAGRKSMGNGAAIRSGQGPVHL